MIDRFELLLKELGDQLNVPLHADKRQACHLLINQDLNVHFECNPSEEKLVIATFLCELPPGKFREEVLKEALKANDIYPRIGTLAYVEKNSSLVFFNALHLPSLSGEFLAQFLLSFVDRATSWKTAVLTGSLTAWKN